MATSKSNNTSANVAANSKIPTEHVLLDLESVSDLDRWMTDQLEDLEIQFAEFVTAESTRDALRR